MIVNTKSYLLLLCMLSSCNSYSQKKLDNSLKIGDTMHDIVFNKLYNYPSTSISLSQLKEKYIILDFWSSWCGSCIESIPEMHDLQKKFASQLKVLMVNSYANDNKKKVEHLFSVMKQRTGKSFELTYMLGDSVLCNYFPHQSIPHYVWLDNNRRVAAITGKEEVTAANIQEWLNGKALSFHVKNDELFFDETKTQLVKSDSTKENDFLYRSLITNYKEDLGSVIGKKMTTSELVSHFYIINYSLLALYQIAFPEIFTVPYNRIIIDSSIQSAFFINNTKEKKSYCYDLLTRPLTYEQITQAMRIDLERYFDITARNENRTINCYVLSAGNKIYKSISKGGLPGSDTDQKTLKKYISNRPLSELLSTLGSIFNKPWVDETGLQNNIDISFPYDFFQYNLQQVKEFLLGYGLVISEAPRSILVGLLTQKL